jgi:hypothetical protein
MSDALVGIFFGAGVGGWMYTQLVKRGANGKELWLGVGICAALGFFFIFTLFKYVFGF